MQVKSIAECSKGIILQYFRPSLSYHLSKRSLFSLFLSHRLRQVLLYLLITSIKGLVCGICLVLLPLGGRAVHSLLQLSEKWPCLIWLFDGMKFALHEANSGGSWGLLVYLILLFSLLLSGRSPGMTEILLPGPLSLNSIRSSFPNFKAANSLSRRCRCTVLEHICWSPKTKSSKISQTGLNIFLLFI